MALEGQIEHLADQHKKLEEIIAVDRKSDEKLSRLFLETIKSL